ncbi:hypothetical protein L6164_023728 [Bauhinia variegata]|uniref:Uncharacterized protein n=1 Tax=Bauhinia variegata TaxID=167791 RepID=A0ACB9MJJ2_BAUVA|nr:hypothetical protein L6164_023728 [Bauhinia variegata]
MQTASLRCKLGNGLPSAACRLLVRLGTSAMKVLGCEISKSESPKSQPLPQPPLFSLSLYRASPLSRRMATVLRSAAKLINSSELMTKSVSRNFHSTGMKRMGGGHAHGHDEPYYMHAKHMYNLDRMKYQKVKVPLAVLTAFSIGVFVPVYAVIFQQKKTASA